MIFRTKRKIRGCDDQQDALRRRILSATSMSDRLYEATITPIEPLVVRYDSADSVIKVVDTITRNKQFVSVGVKTGVIIAIYLMLSDLAVKSGDQELVSPIEGGISEPLQSFVFILLLNETGDARSWLMKSEAFVNAWRSLTGRSSLFDEVFGVDSVSLADTSSSSTVVASEDDDELFTSADESEIHELLLMNDDVDVDDIDPLSLLDTDATR